MSSKNELVVKTTDAILEAEVISDDSKVKIKEKKIAKNVPGKNSIEDPHKIIRQGMIIIFLFFGVLGAWSIFAKISAAVVTPGKIKIETERKTVQHLEGGIVDSILVKEGDEVVAGQTLIVLESVQIDASVEMLRKQLVGQQATHARLTAEKDMKTAITWSEELKALAAEAKAEDVLNNEMKLFNARKDSIQGQISVLKSQIAQIDSQISGLEEQYQAEQTIVATLEEELKAKRQLFEERYLEKSQILELERMLASHQGSRGHLKQAISEAKQKRSETKLRIDDMTNRMVEDAASQLSRLDNDLRQTIERLRPLKDAKTRLNVVAPVTGRVVSLKIHSQGGVVRAGEPLLDIVPADNPLIAEIQVPVNKIAELFIGQEARVQLDAFDSRTTPLLKGTVSYISADRIEERTMNGVMPFYLCYVEIDPQAIADAKVYLSPGMPATVFITTKERTVLHYIFSPLIKNWEHALQE